MGLMWGQDVKVLIDFCSQFAYVKMTAYFRLPKGADQLRSKCTVDQCLCFGYIDMFNPSTS